MKIHILGIGGTFMAGIAIIAKQLGHQVTGSDKNLYDPMKSVLEKEKINFLHRTAMQGFVSDNKGKFDLCFIDGDHDNPNIIFNDYQACRWLLKEGGVIVFDDYQEGRYAVKAVVDTILEQEPDLNAFLVPTSGHLFDMSKKDFTNGMMVISTREIAKWA